jgi:peroxiredoxin
LRRALRPFVLTLGLAVCGGPGAHEAGGARAPDFRAQTVDGRPFHLADHLGKDVVLISFWATWCRPCMLELPHVTDLWRELHPKGFEALAVSMDGPESESQVRPTVSRLGLPFTVVVDRDTSIGGLYNPRHAAPMTVLIDRSGQVAWRHEGFVEGDQNEVARRARDLVGQ